MLPIIREILRRVIILEILGPLFLVDFEPVDPGHVDIGFFLGDQIGISLQENMRERAPEVRPVHVRALFLGYVDVLAFGAVDFDPGVPEVL